MVLQTYCFLLCAYCLHTGSIICHLYCCRCCCCQAATAATAALVWHSSGRRHMPPPPCAPTAVATGIGNDQGTFSRLSIALGLAFDFASDFLSYDLTMPSTVSIHRGPLASSATARVCGVLAHQNSLESLGPFLALTFKFVLCPGPGCVY